MIDEFTDARTIKWTLISSPIPVISITLAYIYIIYVAGPRFMRDREAYSLKKFIQYYNIFQIIANFYIAFNIVTYGRPFAAAWRFCETFNELCDSNTTKKQLELMWWGFLLRIIDLSETMVFVLRKKYQQASVLHVYHHVSVVIWMWLVLRYLIHPYIMSIGALNTSVHVIMYLYYFLSTSGSYMQQKLRPFKKWITIIQMIQIILLATNCLQGLSSHCNNKVAKYFGIVTFLNGVPIILLFWNFYRNCYKKSKET